MSNDSNEKVPEARRSGIPILRSLTEADRPEVEALIRRLGLPRKAEAAAGVNQLCTVVERNGKITAVALGNVTTVGMTMLLVDPESTASDGEHDGLLALEAVTAGVRMETAPGALFGLVIFLPAKNADIGKALEREGFFNKTPDYSVHFGWHMNVSAGSADLPSTSH